MKSTRLSLLACALIGAFGAVSLPAAANDDAAKLEALQRALGTAGVPGTEGQEAPKKKRTRAIVFDNEPAAQGAPAAAATQAVAAGPKDCASINPDSPGTAVDFAIQFNAGSAVIAPASAPLLDQIGKVLSMNPNGCIIVEGHTDVSGNADKNTALSKQRAESVAQYLGKAITPTRMVPVGKGSSQLLPGVTPTDAKHRRVAFKIVG